MTPVRERVILGHCLDFLTLHRIPHWRNNTGARTDVYKGKKRFTRFGIVGASDILGILAPSGRWLAIECKRPGEELTEAQAAFIDNIRAAGGLAFCVSDVKQLEAALRAEGVIQ